MVKDDDIKDGDLDLLVDISVKVERMRQEFDETIYYDRWTKDIYSEPEEKTVVNVTEEVTDGSSLFIGLVIKKK